MKRTVSENSRLYGTTALEAWVMIRVLIRL